jgi:hypothetical protein
MTSWPVPEATNSQCAQPDGRRCAETLLDPARVDLGGRAMRDPARRPDEVVGLGARGLRRIRLNTRTSMTSAQRLYERLGFHRDPDHDWRCTGNLIARLRA